MLNVCEDPVATYSLSALSWSKAQGPHEQASSDEGEAQCDGKVMLLMPKGPALGCSWPLLFMGFSDKDLNLLVEPLKPALELPLPTWSCLQTASFRTVQRVTN